LVEATIGDAADGHIAVYARGAEITHAGVVDKGRVMSKWGSGHVWRHGTFAVPASYGSSVRVFRACSSETALRGLIEYFREKPEFGPEVVDAILTRGTG
jgi:hypothetical protein